MNRRHSHGGNSSSSSTQTPSTLERYSFAVGYSLRATQDFIHDFATGVQVSATDITNGVAALLPGSANGTQFRTNERMPGVLREAAQGTQVPFPALALDDGTLRDRTQVTGIQPNGAEPDNKRHMSAEAKARIGAMMRKRWRSAKRAGQNMLVPAGKLKTLAAGKQRKKKAPGKRKTLGAGKKATPDINVSSLLREILATRPLIQGDLIKQVQARVDKETKLIKDILNYMRRAGQVTRDDTGVYRLSETGEKRLAASAA